MTKKLVFLLAVTGLIFQTTGCTSNKAQDETEIVENADVDKIDAESVTTSEGIDNSTLDTASLPTADDTSLQSALGEAPAAEGDGLSLDGAETPPPTDVATTETVNTDIAAAPTLDENSLNEVPPATDSNASALTETPLSTDSQAPPADSSGLSETPVVADSSTDTSTTTTVEAVGSTSSLSETPTKVSSSSKPAGSLLKKIAATTPYQANGGWVNTVYVARPGEKLKQISQKIYGSDRSKDLKKIAENSYLKARSVRGGDKVYYVSPNRPDDSTKMLVFYEDMGMVPETYTAKKGDNLKKVSKEILGYDKAWVEMWTSNPVESKGKLAEGEVLKYWRSASSIQTEAPTLAQNTPPNNGAAQLVDQSQMPQPTPSDMNSLPPPPQPQAQMPPPPDMNQQMAQNTPPPPDMNSLPPPPPSDASAFPPPPSDTMASSGQMNEMPPPPPPPDANVPPPPPPPDAAAVAPEPKRKFTPKADEEIASEGLDQETMMSLGAVGILTVALAAVLIRRRKKRAAAEQAAAMAEHDVGT